MDIKHCGRLSWFLRRRESHAQDGKRLPSAAVPQTKTASGDPAMASRAFHLNARAFARLPKPAAVPPPVEQRICRGIRFKTREQARARCVNGEYPAVRSTTCNALRRHGRGSREVGDAGTPA